MSHAITTNPTRQARPCCTRLVPVPSERKIEVIEIAQDWHRIPAGSCLAVNTQAKPKAGEKVVIEYNGQLYIYVVEAFQRGMYRLGNYGFRHAGMRRCTLALAGLVGVVMSVAK
jgi:hypothetical protein